MVSTPSDLTWETAIDRSLGHFRRRIITFWPIKSIPVSACTSCSTLSISARPLETVVVELNVVVPVVASNVHQVRQRTLEGCSVTAIDRDARIGVRRGRVNGKLVVIDYGHCRI